MSCHGNKMFIALGVFSIDLLQGVKLTFFPGSHLAPKYFKVVANSKKLVAMTHTQKHFYYVIVLDRLNC